MSQISNPTALDASRAAMDWYTCPKCGHTMPNNLPHIRLHAHVSHGRTFPRN